MPAGLESLRDDRVGAMRFEPACLFNGGGGGQHLRTPGPHPPQQFGRRQAEVKAHDRRLEVAQHIGCCVTEWGARRGGWYRVEVEPEFSIVRGERDPP